MRVLVTTPPAPLVEWEDAQAHLNLDTDDQQTLVEGMIDAASAMIDGPDGWLGRAIGVQTLEARFDGFGHHPLLPITLPFPPLIAVTSVRYTDVTGADTVLDPATYSVLGSDIEPVFNGQWPTPRSGRETVRVRYTAGYAADPAAQTLTTAVPAAVRAAILLMVGDLYANRETTIDARSAGAAAIPMSTTVEALLSPFRVWR